MSAHAMMFNDLTATMGCDTLLGQQNSVQLGKILKGPCVRVKMLQSCPALCLPLWIRPPGSSVHDFWCRML